MGGGVPKHPQASLWPGGVVTLAVLFAVKGAGGRSTAGWLARDWRPRFPRPPDRRLPDRTRLFRLFAAHRAWADRLLADATRRERTVVETVLSMLAVVSHLEEVGHRPWRYPLARLAFAVAASSPLVQWRGLEIGADGNYHLPTAEFSL